MFGKLWEKIMDSYISNKTLNQFLQFIFHMNSLETFDNFSKSLTKIPGYSESFSQVLSSLITSWTVYTKIINRSISRLELPVVAL